MLNWRTLRKFGTRQRGEKVDTKVLMYRALRFIGKHLEIGKANTVQKIAGHKGF